MGESLAPRRSLDVGVGAQSNDEITEWSRQQRHPMSNVCLDRRVAAMRGHQHDGPGGASRVMEAGQQPNIDPFSFERFSSPGGPSKQFLKGRVGFQITMYTW